MKRFLLILLAALLLVSLAACGEGETSGETTSVSQYKSKGDYTEVNNILSWEKINAFPMKRADMTEEEMRKLVVDFYNFSKSFVWVSDADYEYDVASDAGKDNIYEGGVYSGMPYISLGTNNVYRFMTYMDPETGVIDMEAAGKNQYLFGNQCSMSCQWAWARVINSVTGGWTEEIVKAKGYVPVGTYTYPDYVVSFKAYGTGDICAENGQAVMFESYAAMKHGDGLVKNNPGGHVIMCTADPYVVYTADGKIDAVSSYVLISEQTRNTGWVEHTNDSGDTYKMTGYIDRKLSFQKLFESAYIPFTFKEYTGADPIEETEVAFSHTGETISYDELLDSAVTSNYNISDIYAIFTDKKGNEVYRLAVHTSRPSTRKLEFVREHNNAYEWGDLNDLSEKQTYTVQIVAQLGTGERPTLWTGTWAQ